jgi:Fe-Mn family superoxide dismutase
MAIQLPPLPYEPAALEPIMSAKTLAFHHGKHHATYVTNYNNLTSGTALAAKPLEDVLREVAADASRTGIFNNGAQAWNHSFFWQCLKPGAGGKPAGEFAARIAADFGSFETFVEQFRSAAVTQFGSGWAWLVLDGGRLKVSQTANADTPLAHGQTPLFTVDVWEHAYYLDYQNRRADFVSALLAGLANWEFAARNLRHARAVSIT